MKEAQGRIKSLVLTEIGEFLERRNETSSALSSSASAAASVEASNYSAAPASITQDSMPAFQIMNNAEIVAAPALEVVVRSASCTTTDAIDPNARSGNGNEGSR